MSSELMAVEGLKVRRGDFVLEIPSWRLDAGTVVGLVGENGSGKTTLLHTLAGFVEPTGGQVRVFGLDPFRDATAVRTRLGYMSDDTPLFDLRVGQLLRTVSGYYPTWEPALVLSLLERFQLEPGRRVRDLSKGEGTRVRLVLAMAFRPRVLLLDEPATGLDLAGRRALLESVLEVVQEPDRSVVVSSHMLGDVERITDRLLVLSGGRAVAKGATDDLVGEERTLEEAMASWGAVG